MEKQIFPEFNPVHLQKIAVSRLSACISCENTGKAELTLGPFGDARRIAGQLGIDEVCANCLPEDKLSYIEISQREKKQICMIGNGINDAPALKKAWVGIAMGGIGSDIAVDSADIVLVDDDIKELPHLLRLAKRMMLTIKCNRHFP